MIKCGLKEIFFFSYSFIFFSVPSLLPFFNDYYSRFCVFGIECSCERERKKMPKMIGNNRPSALKRLSTPYSTTKIDRRPIVGSKTSSINDARQILLNRNQTSFDARQLLSRQASKSDADEGQMVVVTGLKDMKMRDGRVRSNGMEKKK